MAEICPVCNEKITSETREVYKEVSVHNFCLNTHIKEKMRERIKGQSLDSLTKEKKKTWVDRFPDYQIEKNVSARNVHVKSFDMPFGDMVIFMVKWAIASIPAFIILAIIGAIFGSLFF